MLTKREIVLVALTVFLMSIPLVIVASQNQPTTLPSSVFEWKSVKVEKTKVGERRQFFDTPTETLNNLEVHATTLNPGEYAHAAHQHPDEEMFIVQEGTVEALVNGELKRGGPGSVVFQAPNRQHRIQNVGTTRAQYHVIRWRTAKTGAASAKP
ncbi:MAG TPA: cupin domain-containing protein [Hymenobacter sp.]|jgi:quercetin dioxygenase-like cupin family protein|uniref:cupin domain-containing protein n=1 Tax=Hymenobacter sp. TaxID=1898978 RepID=UPI002ED77E9C